MSNVLLLGATGLVGQELLTLLQRDPGVSHICAPARRALAAMPKLSNPQGQDIAALVAAWEAPVDYLFCCLGSTRKTAGSRAAFYQVDYQLVVETAAGVLQQGASHMLVVSALGADARSLLFYNRTKGEMEQALCQQGWPRLTIARPSLLLGERAAPRFFEQWSVPLFTRLPGKWRAISGREVAQALYYQAFQQTTPGVTILESDRLRQLAQQV